MPLVLRLMLPDLPIGLELASELGYAAITDAEPRGDFAGLIAHGQSLHDGTLPLIPLGKPGAEIQGESGDVGGITAGGHKFGQVDVQLHVTRTPGAFVLPALADGADRRTEMPPDANATDGVMGKCPCSRLLRCREVQLKTVESTSCKIVSKSQCFRKRRIAMLRAI